MNVIRLMGGIGNQFFQYAFGRVFEQRGKEVSYDVSWFSQYDGGPASVKFPRIYQMDKFRVKIKFSHCISTYRMVIGGDEKYNEKLFELDNCNFEGYWQHLGYYTGILPLLQGELLLKDEMKGERFFRFKDEITKNESIAVHVRRGDYVGLWPILPMDYYIENINKLKGDVYIFSDDMPWCRNAFKNMDRKTIFVDLQDYLSFELMRLCTHKIVGNSTFSWWAAFLNNTGTIFCPHNWLGWKHLTDGEQRYPKEWIRIS